MEKDVEEVKIYSIGLSIPLLLWYSCIFNINIMYLILKIVDFTFLENNTFDYFIFLL